MEGAILFMMALGGLGAFGVGVVLLVMYWRSGRRSIGEPIVYGNLVQCPRCEYMNPLDSAACLNCQLPLSHQRRAYQPPPSPTYPTLPPQYAQRPAPPPNVPAQYAAPPNQDATVAQVRTPVMPKPPSPQSYDPSYAPPTVRRAAPQPAPPPAPQSITPSPAKSPPPAAARMLPLQHQPPPATPPPPGMPNAWLEGKSGVVAGQRTMLVQTDTLFGRSTQCDVQIYDPKVSRQHFAIRYAEGAFFLQDKGSSRGTMINGTRVNAQRLYPGDQIELGDTILVFHVEG